MIAIPVSTLRDKMKSYLDRVTKSFETIIVSRGASEDDTVVIMSLKEYNALVETNYLLSSKKNRDWIEGSIEQIKRGDLVQPKEFSGKKAGRRS